MAVSLTTAFGGVAEVHGRTASAAFDANDPLQTSDVQCSATSCATAEWLAYLLTDPASFAILLRS
jgi:hypothetical protein